MGARSVSSADGEPVELVLELSSASLEDTLALGRAVGGLCREGDVLALSGELGAGKTQVVRGVAEGMGLDAARVSSPTFVFLQEHEPDGAADGGGGKGLLTLLHLDAYRLEAVEQLASLGLDFDDPEYRAGCVVAVEWPERLGGSIEPGLALTLLHAPPGRRVRVAIHEPWRGRAEALRRALRSLLRTDGP